MLNESIMLGDPAPLWISNRFSPDSFWSIHPDDYSFPDWNDSSSRPFYLVKTSPFIHSWLNLMAGKIRSSYLCAWISLLHLRGHLSWVPQSWQIGFWTSCQSAHVSSTTGSFPLKESYRGRNTIYQFLHAGSAIQSKTIISSF